MRSADYRGVAGNPRGGGPGSFPRPPQSLYGRLVRRKLPISEYARMATATSRRPEVPPVRTTTKTQKSRKHTKPMSVAPTPLIARMMASFDTETSLVLDTLHRDAAATS